MPKLKEVMTKPVECIVPQATLQEAAEKMKVLDIGALPVCESDRLAGIVTDRDITVRATASGRDPKQAKVVDVMTPEVLYSFEDQDVEEAARLMREKQVRRLVVLNRDKRLVGIISLGDLAVDTGDKRLSGDVLQQVSKPGK